MDTQKRIDREFLLSDDTVNVYGFRLLTSGYQANLFARNPIGYRMHSREQGVVLRWEDLKVDTENGRITAKPVVNLSNPMGAQTANEIENGFMNGASMGRIIVLEWSDSPDLMLEGQTGPTVTKWYNKEASIVDMPGNENSVAPQLFDAEGNEINLADFIHETLKKQPLNPFAGFNLNNRDMEFKKEVIAALNLADNTTDAGIASAIKDLADRAAKVPQLESDLNTANAAKTKAVQDLADFKKMANEKQVQDLLDANAKKVMPGAAVKLKEKFAGDPEGLKDLLDAMVEIGTVTEAIQKQSGDAVKDLADKSWEELDKGGLLPDLKTKSPEIFKQKFKEKFGKDPE